MLSVTRKVEYALIGLSHMAALPPGTVVTVQELAAQYHLPVKLLAKVFSRMREAAIVRSHRGKLGGYSLAIGPDEITLARIADILEGSSNLVSCCDGRRPVCAQWDACNIRSPMDRLNHRLQGFLSSVTLVDFVANKGTGGASGN